MSSIDIRNPALSYSKEEKTFYTELSNLGPEFAFDSNYDESKLLVTINGIRDNVVFFSNRYEYNTEGECLAVHFNSSEGYKLVVWND